MGIKQMIHKVHTKLTVRRWIVWLLCAVLIGGMVSPAVPALAAVGDESAEAETSEAKLGEKPGEEPEQIGDVSANTAIDSPQEDEDILLGQDFGDDIDEIEIYDYDEDDDIPVPFADTNIEDIESDHIIAGVTNPPNTTVHMFDYWITGQTDNDYNPSLTKSEFLKWINADHLFLFAGADGAAKNGPDGQFADIQDFVGAWNTYGGTTADGSKQQSYEPYSGIVKRVLNNGYPQLAIDDLIKDKKVTIPGDLPQSADKQTESLAYLFDPASNTAGRAAYPNVTGLFQLDRNTGYYYFNSADTFAELNRDQGTAPKKSNNAGNRITLYDKPWTNNGLGQFFPFNDWSDLYRVGTNGELEQLNSNLNGQSQTTEPMNHYFGMTVETKFQQPTGGKLADASGKEEHMTFNFSGDDDIWIFIDDVLVADLGGLHMRVSVSIDFATGEINYTGDLGKTTGKIQDLEAHDSDLYTMFQKAGMQNTVAWQDAGTTKVFADGSTHTLKFFYLERGNAASNCSISFNLFHDDNIDVVQPGENDATKHPSGNQSNASTGQPAANNTDNSGNKAAPKTGDSARPDIWFNLMVFSLAGMISVTSIYYIRRYRRKRE